MQPSRRRSRAFLCDFADLGSNATYRMDFPGWDYSMRYPVPIGEDDKPAEESKMQEPKADSLPTPFTWAIDAQGQITAHI